MKVVETEKVIALLREKKVPKVGELHRILTQMSFEIQEISEKSDEEQLDMTNVWYEVPMICRYTVDGVVYRRAIVFHEWLVDLKDGEGYRCKDLLRTARRNGIDLDDAIIESFGWVDFSEIFHI